MTIEDLINRLENSYYTKREFNAFLNEYSKNVGIESIFIKITRHNSKEYTYGEQCINQSLRKRIFTVDHMLPIECSIWSKQRISKSVQKDVGTMIVSYIGLDAGLDATETPYYEKDAERGTRIKCENTLKRIVDERKNVAVFMLDLDKFKDVNELYGHACGSSVLHEFSDLLVTTCENDAIVIHRSGDEFYLIMPYSDESDVLHLSNKIRKAVKDYRFYGDNKITLTTSQGICFVTDENTTFQDAVERAEIAYKGSDIMGQSQSRSGQKIEGKDRDTYNKHRNSVRLVMDKKPEITIDRKNNMDRDLAFILTRFGISSRNIFCNPYLNYISAYVSQIEEEENVQREVDTLIEWISPSKTQGMQMLVFPQRVSYKCEWSDDEICFAVFHGLCRNKKLYHHNSIQLDFNLNGHYCEISICDRKNAIFTYGQQDRSATVWSNFVRFPREEEEIKDSRTVVLIQIGYYDTPIPSKIFYRVIQIDERPTIGGNLPDFWAGALAELMDILAEKPCDVIVYGEKDNGKRFCNVLENVDKWEDGNTSLYSFSFLEKKTKQSHETVVHCKKCLEASLRFVEKGNLQKLTSALMEVSYNNEKLPHALQVKETRRKRMMERSLEYNTLKLDIRDGCRVKTLDEAFPIVLELLRTCKFENTNNTVKDQAGRKMIELSNFKVVITSPCSEDIPEYYQTEKDVEELKHYYDSIFGGKDSFFQKYLVEGKQYDSVISHIVNIIKEDGLAYATRRAMMVIPCIVHSDEISPLGLVSIYISPRNVDDNIVIDFSFTWRTVEAVVGFPYSLYGSIKYAEHLFDVICKKSERIFPSNRIIMGTLSYNAYSLHMFQDGAYDKIVRGIINDASR